jgi:hypothetical protein
MVCCEGCGMKLCLATASAWQFIASAQAQEASQLLGFRQAVLRSRDHAFSQRPCMGVRPSAATGRAARRERLRRDLHSNGLSTAKVHVLPATCPVCSDGAAARISARCVWLSVGVRPAAATGRVARFERLRESTSSKGCSNSQAWGRLSFSRSFCITGRSYGQPAAAAQLQRYAANQNGGA